MKDFVWGVATAAAQIEGAFNEDGKGLNIWDVFSRIPGTIRNGDRPDVSCDSYHKWKEDVKLLKDLGVNGYRYSVSWSRILPEGKGQINQKGLDYYRRLTDALAEAGIAPNITLYHWDLPYELERLGGWLNRDVADWFADYADIVFRNIPNAQMFATHNEPIATYVGYALKGFAPGFGLEKYGRQANHNLLLSHGKAVERFRSSGNKAKIGIVVDIWNRVPADPYSEADVRLAKEQNGLAHGSYLSPLFCGEYIVDSLLLAVQLFHETSKYLYAQLANRIYINAFRRAQRPNGGAGCDSCLCESEKELKVLMYEAFFCCTMRYAEGLLCVYENTLFEENGKKLLLFHEQCSDEKTVVNIAKSNNEKHFSVECDGVVKIYVPEYSKCDRKVVDGFLSAFQGEEVTLTDIKSTKKLSGLKVDMCGDEVLLKDEEGEAGNWQNCLSMTEEEAGKKVWRM